jgi:hypothetical protein
MSEAGIKLKDIPGFSKYAVTADGSRFWSKEHNTLAKDGAVRHYSGRWLRPGVDKDLYLYVKLWDDSGKVQKVTSAWAVLAAWKNEPAKPFPKAHVRHLDGDKCNNHYSNIAWGTAKQNADDRMVHGTYYTGDMHPTVKYSDDLVRRMYVEYLQNKDDRKIRSKLSLKYGMKLISVVKITAKQVRWRLTDEVDRGLLIQELIS